MKISPDDPNLTAFALGEIEDRELAKRIQEAVDESAELRATVEAIRATSVTLREALAAETISDWSDVNRIPIVPDNPPREPGSSNGIRNFVSWPWLTAGAAAAVLLIAAIGGFISVIDGERQVTAANEIPREESAETPMIMAGRAETDAESGVIRDEPVTRRFGEFSGTDTLPPADAAGVIDGEVLPDLRSTDAVTRSGEEIRFSEVSAPLQTEHLTQYDAAAGDHGVLTRDPAMPATFGADVEQTGEGRAPAGQVFAPRTPELFPETELWRAPGLPPGSELRAQFSSEGRPRAPIYTIDPETGEPRPIFMIGEPRRSDPGSSIRSLLDELRAKYDDPFAMPGSNIPDTEQRLLMELATEVLELRSEIRNLRIEIIRLEQQLEDSGPE